MSIDAKEQYKKWIFEGNCPCCFPYWEYGLDGSETFLWEDEFQAWAVYKEIMDEYND